ncbi:MAG: hypothetical protein K8R68_04775, partial [Bacteroidales bacterium]|nr:hypothetical protein [Bacteroidales bacterium]
MKSIHNRLSSKLLSLAIFLLISGFSTAHSSQVIKLFDDIKINLKTRIKFTLKYATQEFDGQ